MERTTERTWRWLAVAGMFLTALGAAGTETNPPPLTLSLATGIRAPEQMFFRPVRDMDFFRTTGEGSLRRLETNPEVIRFNDLGFLSLRAGRLNESLGYFKQAFRLEPTNLRVRFGISTSLIALDRHSEAVAILEPLSKEFSRDYYLQNNLAWVLTTTPNRDLLDAEKAIRLAREALLYAPSDYHVWSTLAEAHYVFGDYDRALAAARTTMDLVLQAGGDVEMETYARQFEKCRRAVEAFTLVE